MSTTETRPRYEYDREAVALYVYLSDKPYAYGRDLDPERHIDYAADGTPIGVELTCVRSGVNLDDLPAAAEIADILKKLDLPAYA
jgi:uncharacterized protein YuzE